MGFEYKVGNQVVNLEVDSDLVGIRYTEPAPHSMRSMFCDRVGTDAGERHELPNEKFTLLKTPSMSPASVTDKVSEALADDSTGIMRTAPVFKIGETRMLATDRILVGMQNESEPVSSVLTGINYQNVVPRGFGEYTVTLAPDVDPLSTVTRLSNHPKIGYVEPDFVNVTAPLKSPPALASLAALSAPPDQAIGYHPGQYAVEITQAAGAWALQTGDSEVLIAILDDGVDTSHPDLKPALRLGYDASDRDRFQEPNKWDGHGTACAGLAAAVPSSADGVRGIGAGCSLLPVRIAYSNRPRGPWVTTNGQIAEAIEWSWRNGACVISNSWGGSAPSTAITNAFERAMQKGRDGKGCVIVIAAGNSGGAVLFPANMDNVLCVAASTAQDEPKQIGDQSSEPWWGSCYGPQVSVAAPGIGNLTADITGPSGYNPDGNYTATFNGTSSATPIVAGACGLVLSANPALRGSEVRDLIMRTADQVGTGLDYANGRNDLMGHGRLNVLRAVQAALLSREAPSLAA